MDDEKLMLVAGHMLEAFYKEEFSDLVNGVKKLSERLYTLLEENGIEGENKKTLTSAVCKVINHMAMYQK